MMSLLDLIKKNDKIIYQIDAGQFSNGIKVLKKSLKGEYQIPSQADYPFLFKSIKKKLEQPDSKREGGGLQTEKDNFTISRERDIHSSIDIRESMAKDTKQKQSLSSINASKSIKEQKYSIQELNEVSSYFNYLS